MTNFAGRWLTTFGPMELRQTGDAIEGEYRDGPIVSEIRGTVAEGRFTFEYKEPTARGEGWFDLARHGKFQGEWRPLGGYDWKPWVGNREWDGIWQTTYGPMRLVQEPDRVVGFYEGAGSSSIGGTVEADGKLLFRYTEPKTQGEGWFELGADLVSFSGLWAPDGASGQGTWTGQRVQPQPNFHWLIVLEAHWQRCLSEKEYSYGNMLKEFFARLAHVGVRHRFFNDAASLEKWCREILYLAEPCVVLFATHGGEDGLLAHGQTIYPEALFNLLPYADPIQLLHFSACLMMKKGKASELPRKLSKVVRFPISGYTTAVDWGGSALIEFSYLDMIFSKGLTPEDAATRLLEVVPYAGDTAPAGSPYPGAGFRFLPSANGVKKTTWV